MNLIYFKADIGNFGDDLNPWLWEKLLGDFSQYPDDIDFVGIGSILDERIEANPERSKIIFGSGIRDVDYKIHHPEKFDVKFVRGPISGKILNAKYITDSAYGLRLLPKQSYTKKFKLSFIPYFRHVPYFDWAMFEKLSGIHIILPTNSVDQVIQEINESELILTSAMHGAILADIYRVPWMRVKFRKHGFESLFTSELKWQDWLRSVSLSDVPTHFFDFTFDSKSLNLRSIYKMLRMMRHFKHNDFCLSKDAVVATIDDQLNAAVLDVRKLQNA